MLPKKINLAIVAARQNSKGVKNKNLIKIKNNTITKIAVTIGLKSKKIDKIILSSDSLKILNSVPNNRNLIKLKRRKSLAKDKTPMLPVIQDAIQYFENNTNKKYFVRNLVILDPTSPLRKVSDVDESIKFFEKKKPDLLVSVHDAQHNPYFSIVEKKKNFFSLCKGNSINPGSRQSVPRVYEINTAVWIYSRRAIFHIKKRIPKKTLIFLTPIERSIDIDNNNDIQLINYYLKNNEKKNK